MAKEFTQLEDRCLLLLAHAHGFGEWGKVAQDLYRVSACMPEVKSTDWSTQSHLSCQHVWQRNSRDFLVEFSVPLDS